MLGGLAALATIVVLVMRCGGRDEGVDGGARSAVSSPNGTAGLPRRLPALATGTLRIDGRAVDPHDRAIAGARITLDDALATTSDDEGRFAFGHIAAGDHVVRADAGPAYGEGSVTVKDAPAVLAITLVTGPTLIVHVVDPAGVAIAGATVSAPLHVDTLTDAGGEVTLRGLKLRADVIDVSASGRASARVLIDAGDDAHRTMTRRIVLRPAVAIGGIVLDEADLPVAEASVEVRSSSGWSDTTTSDPAGRWRLDGFGVGTLTLEASSSKTIEVPVPPVSLDGAGPRLDLVVRVERGATITGLTVDAAGAPVGEIGVRASSRSTVSDSRGRFSIERLAPGETTIDASSDRLGTEPRTVQLRRGGHADLRLVMVASTLAGRVVDGHGAPIPNVGVSADGVNRAFVVTDEQGEFDFGGVPPGEYRLSARRDGERVNEAAEPRVIAHSGDRHVVLHLPEDATLSGRVVLDGHPVTHFGVALATDPAEPDRFQQLQPFQVEDGRFELAGLRDGSYGIAIVGPEFERHVERVVVSGGQAATLGDIAVTAGRRLRGRVVDQMGAPVADATVVVTRRLSPYSDASLSSALDGARCARSDPAGRFELAGLPAELAGMSIRARNDDALSRPRTVDDADLGHDLELVVEATGSATGVIAGALERVQFVRVTQLATGQSFSHIAHDGSVTFAQLPVGDYVATLVQGDELVPPVEFHVVARASSEFRFESSAFVDLEVSVVGTACTGVVVAPPDLEHVLDNSDRWISIASCGDGQHASIPRIAPGRYLLCSRTCTPVEVAAAPSVQEATITETEGVE
jgi:protocatechuate 3,4-dioxygenase beta subunit